MMIGGEYLNAHYKSNMDDSGTVSGFRCEKPAPNDLSYGTT
jgi:hypothetical protein